MKLVVLGGGGFVGSHLSERLLDLGYAVNVFDRPQSIYLEYLEKLGANIITGDFLDSNDIRNALSDCDVVFHLVSTTVPKTSNDNPVYDLETNVLGTLRLLEEARLAHVKKVVFASSGGTVYGIPKEIPIKESHPTEPISSYGISKLTIEKYLHLYWTLYELDYCILRVANAYGERQPVTETQGVIASFLSRALRREGISVWGDGSVVRDYLYVEDIVSAFVKSISWNGYPKIFNIGSGQGYSIKEIVSIVESVTGEAVKLNYNLGRLFDVPVNILDISRAKAYLSWEPKVDLFEGMQRTYKWMLPKK